MPNSLIKRIKKLAFQNHLTVVEAERIIEALNKQIPMKPEEVERNVYRCLSCEKIIIPIGERKIWYKHFTPSCPNCGRYRDWETDRKSTRLNSSHSAKSRMPSSA